MKTAVNAETGETAVWDGNAWQKADQVAAHPQSGAKAYLVGGRWLSDEQQPATNPKAAPTATFAGKVQKALDTDPGVGMAEATTALGTGAVAAPLGGLAGLAGSVLPGPQGQGADWSTRVSDALTFRPRTTAGKAITGAATKPLELLAEGADKVAAPVADAGYPMLATGINTGIQALPMIVAKVLPKGAAALKPAGNAATEAGFKVTPQEGGGGIIQKNAASIAGEPRLARGIAQDNAALVHETIAKDFPSLKKGEVITRDTPEQIRELNGEAYARMRKAGRVKMDEEFRGDLEATAKDARATASELEHRKESPVLKVVDSLKAKESMDANTIVSEIKTLRADAKKAFKNADNELGRANLSAAEALEKVLDRHADRIGKGNAALGEKPGDYSVQDFRNARQQIAKSYDLERAIMDDGKLDPQVYAKLLANKKPLSGGALTVAEAATAAPRSLAKPSTQGIGATFADAGLAAIESLRGTGGLTLPILLGRAGIRGAMKSDLYQSGVTRGGIIEAGEPATIFTNPTQERTRSFLQAVLTRA